MQRYGKLLLLVGVVITIAGCNGSGGTATSNAINNDGIGDSNGNDSAYTLVINVPYAGNGQTGANFYNDLLAHLTVGQSKVPASRILLSTQNPSVNPDLFAIGDTVGSSGLAVQFLAKLATSTAAVQVYVFPDVEVSSQWASWTPPVANPSISSCTAASDSTNTVEQQDALKSICWASLVNQLIAKEESGSVGAINGVAYDGQSFILGQAESTISWMHDMAAADNLFLGWVSGGLKSSVDLNLIEVYNIGTYNHTPVRVDEIEPQKVLDFFSSGTITTPVCSGQYCSYTGIFPGVQWATYVPESTGVGAVGANIYQCAISNTPELLQANSCDESYTNVIDVAASPDAQMMQSFNYIYSNASPIFGTPPEPAESGNAIVYLFSTEYIGPMQSYYGSHLQCAEASGNCSCIASLYNSAASCGDGNNFGTWGSHLDNFINFTNEFLTAQEVNGQCPAPGGCAAGIYMYDYIPQEWYR
ncbi:MAG: hypothetical protein KBD37_07855 [Burkholderiales bacterium]|nr:hypothetical protein [Burkholderiales bacterium]